MRRLLKSLIVLSLSVVATAVTLPRYDGFFSPAVFLSVKRHETPNVRRMDLSPGFESTALMQTAVSIKPESISIENFASKNRAVNDESTIEKPVDSSHSNRPKQTQQVINLLDTGSNLSTRSQHNVSATKILQTVATQAVTTKTVAVSTTMSSVAKNLNRPNVNALTENKKNRMGFNEVIEFTDTAKPTFAYQDRLIDPESANQPEQFDSLRDKSVNEGNTYHTLTIGSAYTDGSSLDTRLDHGVQYSNFTPTINYGDIRLHMTVLEEDTDTSTFYTDVAQRQHGLRRLSIEQQKFPINDSLLMDNIIGTHLSGESTYYRFINTGTVGQRFNRIGTDILGLTTRLRSDSHSLTFSAGEIGVTSGRFLPGFVDQQGDLQYLAFRRKNNIRLVSTDLWRTHHLSVNGNNNTRVGWRGAMDYAFNEQLSGHVTAAQSGESSALLASTLFQGVNTQHELGGYYFDPDFIWIRTVIGNDSIGALYKFTGNTRLSTISASLEHRKDEFDSNAFSSTRTTQYISAGWAQRINRKFNHSAFYSLRKTHQTETSNPNRVDHSLRWNGTRQHHYNQSSAFRLAYNTSDDLDSWLANYRWRLSYAEASSISLYAEQEYISETNFDAANIYSLGADWQTQLYDFHYLTVGTRYRNDQRDSFFNDTENWGATLAYQWQISSQLEISLHVDYNQLDVTVTQEEAANTLFTEGTVNTSTEENYNSNATLTLRYEFGNARQPFIYGKQNRYSRGAGEVHGLVFVDENNDGIFQAHETRVSGIRLLLDGYHEINSTADGRFTYANVSPGEHFIYINEAELPLPLTTNGQQRWAIKVDLRRTSQIEIPLGQLD